MIAASFELVASLFLQMKNYLWRKMMIFKHWKLILLAALFFAVHVSIVGAQGEIFRNTYSDGERFLTVELLDNDLAHFQLSDTDPSNAPIWTTPMVFKTDYAGPTSVSLSGDG